MLLGPLEWGYCANTQQAKPPRSHYDHVSQSLVLNLDHYCPWMFNASEYCKVTCLGIALCCCVCLYGSRLSLLGCVMALV